MKHFGRTAALLVALFFLAALMSQVIIVQASPQSAVGFQCYGAAREFWRYKGPEAVLSGPYECVAGETQLIDPTTGTAKSIEWYAQQQIAPTVLTLYGAAKAEIPFQKGYAPLYRLSLDSGHSFVATKGHRVLTQRGWISVGEVAVSDCLLGCAETRQVSSSASCRAVSLQDARNYAQTTLDSPVHYLTYFHQCDAQPLTGISTAQAFPPSPNGARAHNRADHSMDASGASPEYSRRHQLFFHPSSDHFAALNDRCFGMANAECLGARYIPSPYGELFQSFSQYHLTSPHLLPFSAAEHHSQHKQLVSAYDPPANNYTVFASTVTRVDYVRTDAYFDLTVPKFGHYLAEGIWHHNTGKTMTALTKLHCLLAKYPNSRALALRKTYNSLINSVVPTFEQKVLPYPPGDPRCAVTKFGGEHPEFYDYPHGSRLWLGGMDNPVKFLSSEFDFIYINQLEELILNDYEQVTSRATGRAGNAPYAQVMADCNPGPPGHWILQRSRLKLFSSKHEDNPTLFNQITGQITERGQRTMETLNALTGVRYKRGRLGLWAGAEGQVYEEWDDGVHLIDRFPIPADWPRYRSIDFGYSNPFVCQWWAKDPDGRLYLYREIYKTGRLVEDHASDMLRLEAGKSADEWKAITDEFQADPVRLTMARQDLAAANERITATVADWDAEDRATLDKHGISTKRAEKSISTGIQAVQARLRVQRDGKPRLFILADSLVETDARLADKHQPTCTRDEVLMYVWPSAPDGKPVKEVPVDLNNHGMDGMRYMVQELDNNGDAAIYVGSRRVG